MASLLSLVPVQVKMHVLIAKLRILPTVEIDSKSEVESVLSKTSTVISESSQIHYIDINTIMIMRKYLFPDDQWQFTYRGSDKKIINQQFTVTDIKRLLDDNKKSTEFYHYLPFNFVTREGSTIDQKGWDEKIDRKGFTLKAGIKFYDDHPNNYIEVESYYSGRFNPPKGSVGQRETFWDGAKREIREELKVIVRGRCPRKNTTIIVNIYNQKHKKNFIFKAIFIGYEIIIRRKTKIRYFKIKFLSRGIIDRTIIPLIKQNIKNKSTEITQIRKKNS